jgi:hypothetical protein
MSLSLSFTFQILFPDIFRSSSCTYSLDRLYLLYKQNQNKLAFNVMTSHTILGMYFSLLLSKANVRVLQFSSAHTALMEKLHMELT